MKGASRNIVASEAVRGLQQRWQEDEQKIMLQRLLEHARDEDTRFRRAFR